MTWEETLDRLEEISPVWAQRLWDDTISHTSSHMDDLGEYPTCVVGEAYGWSGSYQKSAYGWSGCQTCEKYADRIFMCIDNPEGQIDGFVRHFKKCHQEKKVEVAVAA